MTGERQADHGFGVLLSCTICRRTPTQPRTLFCEDHYLQYQVRQQEGVTTEELDPRWRDTLANWRERPAALDREPAKDSFRLGWRFEGWLLFYCDYSVRDNDWMAVQAQTGSIRRFVDTALFDVQDDLLGLRPALHQEHLEERWGRQESSKPPHQIFHDKWHRVQLDKLIAGAEMSIYGVYGNPLGLTLSSLQTKSGSRGLQVITLIFHRASPVKASCIFRVSSIDFYSLRRFRWPEEATELNTAERLEQSFSISDISLVAEIHWWEHEERSQFTLRGEQTFLMGDTSGFSQVELFQLLEHLVIVNHRPELISQYQAELGFLGPSE